jgi:hypothetical protein
VLTFAGVSLLWHIMWGGMFVWVVNKMGIVRQSARKPTTQPTTHNPQPTTHNIKMSRRHPTLQQLCPLSPWVGQWRPQILAPRLPMGPQQAPGGGFTIAVAGSLAWGTKTQPIKIRERDRVLALGGRRLDVKRNNQPKVGVSGERIIIEETQLRWNV